MNVLEHPVMAPGKCVSCGASYTHDGRKYVDTGVDIDYYGVVYYCSICFGELARKLNWIPRAEHDTAIKTIRDQTTQINGLITRIEEYEDERVNLRRTISTITHADSPVPNEPQEPSNASEEAVRGFKKRQSGASKSDSSGRSEIFSDLTKQD